MRESWVAIGVAAGLVAAVVLGLRAVGALQTAELFFYDRYVSAVSIVPARASSVALIEITEPDLRALGQWPISDGDLTRAIERIFAEGPRVVGLDLYRDFPVSPGSREFTRLQRDESRLFGVRKFGAEPEDVIPGPPTLEAAGRVGFNDLPLDDDGRVRRTLLFQDDGRGGEVETSFSLALAMHALAEEGVQPEPDADVPEWLRLGSATLRPFSRNDGGYRNVDDGGYQLMLDYAAAARGFETHSLGDVLAGRLPAGALTDKVVIMGSNAASTLGDVFTIPAGTGKAPGMAIHGHAVDQLLRFARGESVPRWVLSEHYEALCVVLVALAGCILGLGLPGRPALSAGTWVVAVLAGLAALWIAGALVFRAGGWLPIAAPGLAWLGTVGVVTAWVSSRERAERDQLMGLFSRTNSPELAEELWRRRDEYLANGRPKPQRLIATVLFVDMRGYTEQASKMDPEDLVAWSNAFLEGMAERIREHRGWVDDYFGDGIKAAFGVPIPHQTEAEQSADARNAATCALAIEETLTSLNERYRSLGLPECATRVGIHTGAVVASSIGDTNKLKYTVVGDVVVVAQRLEGTRDVAHDFEARPCRILISAATRERLGDGFHTEPVGALSLAGLEEPVEAVRLLGKH
jgi:adenylate cyclase